ncbi:MAG: ATP-binding protein [Clostridia bacterium]|nr:ATP-binding protein [Clostridia bacterium]
MHHAPEWYSQLRDVGMLWQALGGVALFWNNMPKRKFFRLYYALFWILGAAFFLLARRSNLLWVNEGSNVYIVYFLSIIVVLACCKVSIWVALMVGASGFLAQQICGGLELALRSIPAVGAAFDYSNLLVLLDVLFFGTGYYLIWRIYRNKTFRENEHISPLQMGVFSILSFLFSLGFYTVNQYVRGWTNFSPIELTINSLYISIGGIFLLVMQYELIRMQRLNADVQSMKAMLHAQENQWQQGKERAELVNEKYHDLKKLVNSFQGKLDAGMFHKLSKAIESYDDKVETGNRAANVVLTEARELCRSRGIQFTCYVKGSDLDFMEDLDIYSFLKNTMDNAVDAVEKLPEGKERFISLTVRRDGDMIALHEENPCEVVIFENGLPTSEKDPDYHGFGMKSMMRIANKYGGAITAKAEDGVFSLDAIFMPK